MTEESQSAATGESGQTSVVLGEADVLRCVPGLRALLLRLTRNLDATNDLTQEVIIAVILAVRAGRLREPAALAAYVHQVARNQVASQVSKPKLTLMDELPDLVPVWNERVQTPLEAIEADELRMLALAVLAELPTDRDRAVISGYYIDGLSKPELMAKLGLPADQFDRVISRARMRMRERLLARMNERPGRVREGLPPEHLVSREQRAL
jgi:RNA polymerase sigma factor (sigma-70 family)